MLKIIYIKPTHSFANLDFDLILQCAIALKQPDTVAMLIGKGVDLTKAPPVIPEMKTMPGAHESYRKAPFIIQAAVTGCLPVVKNLVAAGCSLTDVGHIGFSRRH